MLGHQVPATKAMGQVTELGSDVSDRPTVSPSDRPVEVVRQVGPAQCCYGEVIGAAVLWQGLLARWAWKAAAHPHIGP
jgi:hypothetical protein